LFQREQRENVLINLHLSSSRLFLMITLELNIQKRISSLNVFSVNICYTPFLFFLPILYLSKTWGEGGQMPGTPSLNQCQYVECSRYCEDAMWLVMLEGTAITMKGNTLDRKQGSNWGLY
jgi:hypothetical protein